MRISDLDVTVVADGQPTLLNVKIGTDEGLTGESQTNLPARPAALLAILQSFKSAPLIGADPTQPARVQHLLAALEPPYDSSAAAAAIGLIETACWDLTSKRSGVSLCHLLGGAVRDSVPACAFGWEPVERTTETLCEAAREVLSQGFRIVKFAPFSSFAPDSQFARTDLIRALRSCEVIRAALGPDVSLWLDFGGLFSAAEAVRVAKAVKRVDPAGIFDPLSPKASHHLRALSRKVNIPLAISSRTHQSGAFRHHLVEGALGLLATDPIMAGGVTATRALATLASAHGVAFALKTTSGPIAIAQAAELGLALSSVYFIETPIGLQTQESTPTSHFLTSGQFLLGNILELRHNPNRLTV